MSVAVKNKMVELGRRILAKQFTLTAFIQFQNFMAHEEGGNGKNAGFH